MSIINVNSLEQVSRRAFMIQIIILISQKIEISVRNKERCEKKKKTSRKLIRILHESIQCKMIKYDVMPICLG